MTVSYAVITLDAFLSKVNYCGSPMFVVMIDDYHNHVFFEQINLEGYT